MNNSKIYPGEICMLWFIFPISASQVIFKLLIYVSIFIYFGPLFFKSGWEGMKKDDRNCFLSSNSTNSPTCYSLETFHIIKANSLLMSVELLMIYSQVHSPELVQNFWTSDSSLNVIFSYALSPNIQVLLSSFKCPYLSNVLMLH